MDNTGIGIGIGIGDARIRVLVTDDQALVRRGMSLMIAIEPDMEVVGEASNGVEAVELVDRLGPDVVLMDLHMPSMNGVAATREIVARRPATHVLVLTTLDDDETVFEAVRAGAQGYLLKDASEDELLETIRALHRGESRMTPAIARKVMDQFRQLADPGPGRLVCAEADRAAETQARHGLPTTEPLTPKEARILALVAAGHTNRQIADTVFLAEGTVKNYVSRIMEKLHANTRTELAVLSLKRPPAV